jgi:hypothetical protein
MVPYVDQFPRLSETIHVTRFTDAIIRPAAFKVGQKHGLSTTLARRELHPAQTALFYAAAATRQVTNAPPHPLRKCIANDYKKQFNEALEKLFP